MMIESNREMFASMSLEPKPEVAAAPKEGKPQPAGVQEANTERIILCMKEALRTSLANISMEQKGRPLNPSTDFIFKAKVSFTAKSSARGGAGGGGCCSATPVRDKRGDSLSDDSEDDDERTVKSAARDLGDFNFTDYSPMCYRHIREFFGIEWKTFQEVLVSSKWHSIPTPGKSTAQLFFCGQNWVVKTMTKEESKFLRDILHRYYYHVRDNPHTLLPHFVGHHSLELELDGSARKISFVIMQNVFATPNKIHEKFDLKGSTVGRAATQQERRKQTCTKKDLDVNRPIRVGPARRALLMDQMRRDCDFLKKASIMDYSFLLGIHRPDGQVVAASSAQQGAAASTARTGRTPMPGPQAAPGATEDERCFTAYQGGMLSLPLPDGGGAAEREVYYVGIIDILQEYNLWKRSETVVRGVIDDHREISSVHPKDYAARFVSFMSTLVV